LGIKRYNLNKYTMNLEQIFKKETGFDAYKDNDLEPKIPLGYYVEWLEEQLKLSGVSQQRELLEGFVDWFNANDKTQAILSERIEEYLKTL